MIIEHGIPPSSDEVEVSVFGPGFGECIVVHVGENRWIVIDSCLDKVERRASALAYLDRIGVNPSASIDLIVCTHWHDDHIRGMASIVDQAPGATFVCSSALRDSAFLELVALGENVRGAHGGKLSEVDRIFNTFLARHQSGTICNFMKGSSDVTLFDQQIGSNLVKIRALSPSRQDSDLMAEKFQLLKAELLGREYRSAVPSVKPNLGSIVLHVQIGADLILLGADMERRAAASTGWSAILSLPGLLPSSIYKVAHHGSKNGDTPRIWSDLLLDQALGIVTPNQRLQNPLPMSEDLARMQSTGKPIFLTASSSVPKKNLSQPAEKIFRRKGVRVQEHPTSQGQVRCRKRVNSLESWQVSTFGRAFQLS